jgi:hypothetical protein
MGPGENLDDGGDPIALDARDDAGELIPRRSGDGRPTRPGAPPLREEPGDLGERDDSLAAGGAAEGHPAVRFPSAERLDGDTEHLGRLTDANDLVVTHRDSSIAVNSAEDIKESWRDSRRYKGFGQDGSGARTGTAGGGDR